MSDMRASYVGHPGSWRGCIRRGKSIVWQCPHKHPNRDYSTQTNPTAAVKRSGPTCPTPWVAARFPLTLHEQEWAIAEADAIRAGEVTS